MRAPSALRLLFGLTLIVLLAGGATATVVALTNPTPAAGPVGAASAASPVGGPGAAAAVPPPAVVPLPATAVPLAPAAPPVAVAPLAATPLVPDPAVTAARIAAARRERCFGAASVDPARPCRNPALERTVVPAPLEARAAQRQAPCSRRQRTRHLDVCFWGASRARATRTVALVGDSHASHWRAAMQTVVRARGWRAVSIARAGCPLTLAHPDLPGRRRQLACMRWNRAVQRWMAAHPSVSVLFTGAHRGAVLPEPGRSMRATQRAGYAAAWAGLLGHHVRHVVVLRDTPRNGPRTLRCVTRALASGQPAGRRCTIPRAYALRPDPAAQAAFRLRSPQVQTLDLTRYFCSATACDPVIGGALVRRDNQHMTTTFTATMGPLLLRAVDRLSARWPDRDRPVGPRR